jgi:hypothetical protein
MKPYAHTDKSEPHRDSRLLEKYAMKLIKDLEKEKQRSSKQKKGT